jgi:hypothetical protein
MLRLVYRLADAPKRWNTIDERTDCISGSHRI